MLKKKNKLRIGIFSDTYFPYISGVVTAIDSLKEALEKEGHEVFIITINAEDRFKYKKEGHVIRIPGIPTGIYDHSIRITYPVKAIKMVKDLKLDIIHAHTEFGIGLFGKSMAKKLQIPFVQTFHTLYEDAVKYVTKGLFPRLSNRVVIKAIKLYYSEFIDQIIVPSDKVKSILTDKYKIKPEINTIPNGVKIEQFYKEKYKEKNIDKIREELNINKDDFVILWVGRLGYEKNIAFLVNNHKKIMEINPTAKLLIVGGGPEEENLKQLAIKNGIANNVIFTGKVKYEDIGIYYQLGSVLSSASTFETQGLTLIEALAASLPLVCIKDESFTSIIEENYNGFIFKNKNEYIKAMTHLINNKTLLKEMSYNARESSNEYLLSTFAKKVLNVYTKAINNYNNKKNITK